MKKILLTIFTFCFALTAIAQSVYAPLNSDYYQLLDRYEIIQGYIPRNLHLTEKMVSRKQIAALADSIAIDSTLKLSSVDRFNIAYLQNDNWEWSNKTTGDSKKPFLKYLYQKQNAFAQYNSKDFRVQLNPVFYGGVGKENNSDVNYTYINSRGLEVRGDIDGKVGFYSYFADNQASLPMYVRNMSAQLSTNGRPIVPGEAYVKSSGPNYQKTDFITARGYVTFNLVKHISAQFGYDKQFIGNGYRSLILSDNSAAFPFLKITANVWRLQYTMLAAQMTANVTANDSYFQKKYFAYHRLGMNIGKRLNIGLFETIMYGSNDSTGRSGSFDIAYLNPVIFYRAAEQYNGSPDNVLIGGDFKWNIAKSVSIYGQGVLDEFKFSEIVSGKGWWANKWAAQAGIKYMNVFGIRNLDIRLETNVARPYTYTHSNNTTNYTNYLQAVAHPLGANFEEFIAELKFQPLKRFTFSGQVFVWQQGLDNATSNVGSNIFKDYTTYDHEYGNKIGQGIKQTVLLGNFVISYMVKHNLFLDLQLTVRNSHTAYTAGAKDVNESIVGGAIRWNLPKRFYAF